MLESMVCVCVSTILAHGDPGCMERMVTTAVSLLREQQFAEARRFLREQGSECGESAARHFLTGLSYHGEDRAEQAIVRFDKAIAIEGVQPLFRKYRGLCLYSLGRLSDAKSELDWCVQALPEDSDVRFALGMIAFDEDRLSESKVFFSTVIARAPTVGKQARARKRLADVFLREGDLEAARRELEASILLSSLDESVYHRLARVLQRLGDVEGAKKARERIIELRRQNWPSTATDNETRSARKPLPSGVGPDH